MIILNFFSGNFYTSISFGSTSGDLFCSFVWVMFSLFLQVPYNFVLGSKHLEKLQTFPVFIESFFFKLGKTIH